MYTIGQVAKITNLPISTLRYYDNAGLLPELKRQNGIRSFSDHDLDTLNMIDCLKKSGLEIKDIKYYMELCKEGPATFGQRKEIFENQKELVLAEMNNLKRVLAMLNFKCWYYNQAIKMGTSDPLDHLDPDELPEPIKNDYLLSHSAIKHEKAG